MYSNRYNIRQEVMRRLFCFFHNRIHGGISIYLMCHFKKKNYEQSVRIKNESKLLKESWNDKGTSPDNMSFLRLHKLSLMTN